MAKNKKPTYIISAVVLLVLVLGLGAVALFTPALKVIGLNTATPGFVFDETKAEGWWATDNYNARASAGDDYQGTDPIEKLPVATINVFKGEKGSDETACFVMFAYYAISADVIKLKNDKDAEVAASTTMQKVGEVSTIITVLGSSQSVTMANYELIGPESQDSMRGMGYGWVNAGKGYISISSVCPTAGELEAATSPIPAVKLTDL